MLINAILLTEIYKNHYTIVRDHMRRHNGDKPFSCNYCSYRARRKCNVYQHKQRNHKAEFQEEKRRKEECKDEVESKCVVQIPSNLPSETLPKKPRTFEVVHENEGSAARTELSYDNVRQVLGDLYLTSVEIGDYLVVMSAVEDATINGEPYLALQLWLDMKSGKVIQRIWGRTVARATVADINHFKNVCSKHFCDPPCLGCPFKEDELAQKRQGFVVCQTPVLRKISLRCQKVVQVSDGRAEAELQACKNCLKLTAPRETETAILKEEHYINVKQENEGPHQKVVSEQDYYSAEDLDTMIHNDGAILESPTVLPHSREPMSQMPLSSSSKLSEGMPHIRNHACDECEKTFSNIENLEDHKNYVHSSPKAKRSRKKVVREVGPLGMKCELCRKVLNCESYPSHMKRMHGETQNFTGNCFWCGETVSVIGLKLHAKKHHFWGRFSCKECSFKGNFARDLAGHIEDVHRGEALNAVCPQCKKERPVSDIENHYKECVVEWKRQLKKRPKCCETCGKVVRERHYRNHVRKHLREQAEKGDTSIDTANLYFHCDKCERKFTQKNALRLHVLQFHDESYKLPCPSCGLVFDTKTKLNEHERAAHSTDEKYQCKVCGKRYGNTNSLKAHVSTHDDCRFQCKYCPRKLKTALNLKFHERYHTGEKPFTCSVCGNGYVSKVKLQQHQAGVHKIAGPQGRVTGWKRKKK